MTLHLDFETRSVVDLRKTGVYVYAEHPTTDVWCAAYAADNDPVKLWTPGDPTPPEIVDAVENRETIVAHNAAFERVIWKHILGPRCGWPLPDMEQWRCTMAMAYAMALPGTLDGAAAAVNSPMRKDEAGGRLMMQMAKPRINKDGGAGHKPVLTWWDSEEKRKRLYAYCMQDVEAERELEKRLLQLRPFEQKLWQLDQRINDRGVCVDEKLCNRSIHIVEGLKKNLDAEMSRITDFDVTSCTNRNQFAAWLCKKGLPVESVAKEALEELLARVDLAPDVRQAIQTRREGAKAATSKIDALLNGTSADGRAKGLLQYHGTVTGRWGGRRFQPQNIRRPEQKDMDSLVAALMTGDEPYFTMLYDKPLTAVGDAIRSMVRAAPGRKMIAADFANIEGRVAAWFAGEAWKLAAFRAFDNGSGPDLYKLAYSRAFGVPHEQIGDEDPRRQIGKVMELSLQYQGGHGAFVAMAPTYDVDVDLMAPVIKASVAPEVFNKALKKYRPQNGFGMAVETWAALRVLIDNWRAAHPTIKQAWRDLEDAAKNAITEPGAVFSVGPVRFKKSGSFLFMQLPSGRDISFPYPSIKEKLMPWTETRTRRGANGETEEYEADVYKPTLRYMGVDSLTNQWREQFAYGGQIFDYVVQGSARDILAEAMVRVEAAGYPIVLTVHDEIVAEPRADFGGLGEFKKLMTETPSWCLDCPIAAKGWEGERYRKA